MNKRGGRRRKEREREGGEQTTCVWRWTDAVRRRTTCTQAPMALREIKIKSKKRREQEVVAIIVDGCCVSLSFLSFVFKRYISFRGKLSSG